MLGHTTTWLKGFAPAVMGDMHELMRIAAFARRRSAALARFGADALAGANPGASDATSNGEEVRRGTAGEPPVAVSVAPGVWMSKKELAEHLRVSTRWIEIQQKNHALPGHHVGGHRRYRLDEVEGWIRSRA